VLEKGPSQTALGVTILRAVHQLFDGSPKLLDDPVAPRLLGESVVEKIRSNPGIFQSKRLLNLRSHVLLRSRYAEDCLEEAVSQGVTQYVILGAGLDTFAYRQPAWARNLKIMEIDHPASQAAKRDLLNAAGIPLPVNLEFLPVDLETVDLRSCLSQSSLRLHEPVFFSWLGVIVYLTPSAVENTFFSIAEMPENTGVVFSFSSGLLSGFDGQPTETQVRAAKLGEPWQTFYAPEAINDLLRASGFREIHFLDNAEAQQRYYADRPRDLPPPRRVSIGFARV